MQNIKQIFEELQSTNSKKDKEKIIKLNADNQLFKEALQFLLNPFVVTGLSTKKINKQVTPARLYLENGLSVMEYLRQHNTGTDLDIGVVQGFIKTQPEDMQEFYKGLFTKSLMLGCAANTVNKALGKNFIPQFEIQLAEKFFDYSNKVEGRDFTLTLKLDGIRAIILKQGNKIKIFSRQGQPIEGLVEVENELLKLSNKDFVLDGELLISNVYGISSKDQYKATTKIVRRDGEKLGITYRIFDYLEYDEFINQNCSVKYIDRRKALENNFDGMQKVEVLPSLYTGNDVSKITEILNQVRADEQEGLILNLNDAPYEFKRTQNLLKVKVMQDVDLQIIGFEEGQGRLSGTLGRMNVNYKSNVVGVGSGFSDAQREYFWKNQDKLVGRIACVQYFEETQDKDGNVSLRFPVFVSLRELGKIESYS